jgi:ATP-binding protein involved in chromosome partitioning
MLCNKNTKWGELDYLLVDMPPGTGDIQITLGQEVSFDGAVIVTTPQDLSYVDVIKGIEMFDDLKVPTVSIVENMSYHTCSNCNHSEKIFGQGKINQLKTQFGIKNSFELPLLKDVAAFSDKGLPPVLVFSPEHTYSKTFADIALSLDKEITYLKSKSQETSFRYDTSKRKLQIQRWAKKRRGDSGH